MKKALIIDGNSLVYRAFYATYNQLEYFKEHGIIPNNALKLAMLIIFKLLKNDRFNYAIVAFDHQKKTFRNDKFAEYKLNRPKTPPELLIQLPIIKEAIEAMGIRTLSIEGLEADDIIGSATMLLSKRQIKCEVYSSDKDLLQLVNDFTNVNLFKTGISNLLTYTNENFASLFYGLKPQQIPDFKGIAGDQSDNLLGIKGIGEKTAISLLLKYDSFENIYDNLASLTPIQAQKFIEYKHQGSLCKELACIKLDIFDQKSETDFLKKPENTLKLRKIISDNHFKSLEKFLDWQINLFEEV